MIKTSVKKPFTVLVAVIMVIALGVVSLTSMTADLLPEMSLPYMIVITTYPGAGPEKVESMLTNTLESALGTISGVKNLSSSSSDNYSMVQLEFEDDTNMEGALVKVSNAIASVKDYLPKEAGNPTIMEISMDMMATTYLGVSYEGMGQLELSDFVEKELVPYIERQDGVANVNSVGLIKKSILIELNEEKVGELNDKILATVDSAFKDAYNQVIEGKQQLIDGQKEIDDGWIKLEDGREEIKKGWDEIDKGYEDIKKGWDDYYQGREDFEKARKEFDEELSDLEFYQNEMKESFDAKPNKELMYTAIDTRDGKGEIFTTISSIQSGLNAILSYGEYATPQITGGSIMMTAITSPSPSDPTTQLIIGTQLILSEGGIVKASDIPTLTFSQAKLGLTKLKTAIKSQARSGLEAYIGGYNMMREAAGLDPADTSSAAYSPATITKATIDTIDANWGPLWATANSNMSSALLMMQAQEATFDASEKQLDAAVDQLDAAEDQLKTAEDQLKTSEEQLDKSAESLIDGQKKIDDGWDSYYDGLKKLDKQRNEAKRKAGADQLISLNTLSQLIYAQNFEMPAGYINDTEGNSWLVKVGENFDSAEALSDTVLTNIKDVGDVKISDIATITYIDNTGEEYAKMNGNDGILLAIFKASTASTNDVSDRVTKAMEAMEEKYPGLAVTTLLDQGDYIDILVKSVLESMIMGAVLAIIILAFFLKDVKPTIVVAISIPLSVLLAIVCMYFSKISLNIMTLAGLALGIGMLVDNSIVVIENIYRLRGLGLTPANAAVKGAKEVAGPIISSTLTTICVFLPILFATGMVRELILPMCLTVTFCLAASLVIALSVVPASGSTLLKNSFEKPHPWFDKVMDVYGKALDFCLRVKVVPLLLSIGLLAFSVFEVLRMGVVMIPSMATEPIQITVNMPEEMEKEEAYKTADEIIDAILKVDGVETVGAMPSSALLSTVSANAGGSGGFRNFMVYVMMEADNPTSKEIKKVSSDIAEAVKGSKAKVSLSAAALDTSALLGSGLSIRITGKDLNTLLDISEDVMEIVGKVDGYEKISNEQEKGAEVVHLQIDRNKAMAIGLSVAQIYQEINTKLTDEVTATTLTVSGSDMDVLIRNEYQVPTTQSIMDLEFKVSTTDSDGDQITKIYKLSDFAELVTEKGVASVERYNLSRYITVSAKVKEGENATLLARELKPLLDEYQPPSGYSIELGGESDTTNNMIVQMGKMLALGFLFIYLVMVAQFQSLLSPFIILFTIPLAFTGGLLGLLLAGEQLSIMSLMGFMILMGTVVNNGIVFVDYANQLRIQGKERREALIETGKTRMRPILMTALTTILAMVKLALGTDMAGQMGRGMAIVIMGGLTYATFMTLFIVPVIYDILFKRQPLVVDVDVE